MSTVEVVATIGITANMTAMAWVMKTLYALRQEISGTHARHDASILALDVRVALLELKAEPKWREH